MKNIKFMLPIYLIASITLLCIVSETKAQGEIPAYKPSSPELYAEIVRMDSIWDDSYNHCKMDVQEQIISEDLEFYHDNSGLLTSKTKLIAALKLLNDEFAPRHLYGGTPPDEAEFGEE